MTTHEDHGRRLIRPQLMAASMSMLLVGASATAQTWTEEASFVPAGAVSGDRFGLGIDVSGTLAAIGAYNFTGPGTVYLFDITNLSNPVELTSIQSPSPAPLDFFGWDQGIAIDGSALIVGAGNKTSGGLVSAGEVFTYDVSTPSSPTLERTIVMPGGPEDFGQFGSVAADGGRFVAGAQNADASGIADAGAAWIFDTATGTLLHQLLPPGPLAAGDKFGSSLAIAGNTVLVAAYQWNNDQGKVFAFAADSGNFLFELTAPGGGAPGDQFGIDIDFDGSTAIVGANGADPQPGVFGAAYTFDLGSGFGNQTLLATEATERNFGWSVSVDGNRAAVGALPTTLNGAAYAFDLTTGVAESRLDPAGSLADGFGQTLVLFDNAVLVGAVNTNSDTGRAYIFTTDDPTADPTLALVNSGPACSGVQVTVDVTMTGQEELITGGQFRLEYDTSVLDFVSMEPGDAPFTNEILENVNEAAGTIDYLVGTPLNGNGTSDDSVLARITFDITGESCTPITDLVSFRSGVNPPSRLTYGPGLPVDPTLVNLDPITLDTTAPVFDTFPADIDLNADARRCDLTLSASEIGAPTASDNCDSSVTITFTRSDGQTDIAAPFGFGATTITWRATDDCGNFITQDQTVTVSDQNELDVAVELAEPVTGTFERCITFELWQAGCGTSETVQAVLNFVNGRATGTILVPCGDYECITAYDPFYTLRRTDDDGDFAVVTGSAGEADYYVTDFTNTTGSSDDSLIGGNYLNDNVVDILDFGVIVAQFNDNVGSNVTCADPAPLADGDGSGVVDAPDFNDFFVPNIFRISEPNCCGQPDGNGNNGDLFADAIAAGHQPTPVRSITINELHRRGLGHLAEADLNNDGVLDQRDIAIFQAAIEARSGK